MRGVLGLLSVVLALVVVGMLVKSQLAALGTAGPAPEPAHGAALPQPRDASGAAALQHRIKDDVTRLMQPAPDRGDPSR